MKSLSENWGQLSFPGKMPKDMRDKSQGQRLSSSIVILESVMPRTRPMRNSKVCTKQEGGTKMKTSKKYFSLSAVYFPIKICHFKKKLQKKFFLKSIELRDSRALNFIEEEFVEEIKKIF